MGAETHKVEAQSARQAGRIHYRQLLDAGFTHRRIASWVDSGRLIRTRQKVFAVGYPRRDRPAQLWDAILFAGPGASLTGATGAHHCGLLNRCPRIITVATPKQRPSVPGIRILGRRNGERRFIDGLPVAPLAELLLDLATEVDDTQLRFALGNLEFRRQLDLAALQTACRRGRSGSRQLRHALEHRLPQLAHTKSRNEVDFLLLLEAHHLPLPQVNVRVHGIEVDAHYRELGLVVEIDTEANHGTAAQQRRDRANTQRLQSHGLTVLRLTDIDIHHRIPETLARLAAHGVHC